MVHELWSYLSSAAVVGGLIIWYIKEQINEVKKERAERDKRDLEYRKLSNNLQRTTGELLDSFHTVVQALGNEHDYSNKEFEKKFEAFKKAEKEIQAFEQDVFIQHQY